MREGRRSQPGTSTHAAGGLSELDRFAGTDGRWDAQLQWHRSSWYGLADEFRLSTKRADRPAGGLAKNLFVSGRQRGVGQWAAAQK